MSRRAAAVVGVALLTTAPLAGHRSGGHPDGPPPATTGGFGEPTCASCHFPPSVPDSVGSLSIEGLPERYRPGRRYEVTVALDRPEMELAGFQLSARVTGGPGCGAQAGAFEASGPELALTTSGGIQYVQQTAVGAIPDSPDRARWTVRWTAPSEPFTVVFHAAANAANGDDSPLGDRIYAIERRVSP